MREIKFRAWDNKNKKMVSWGVLVRDKMLLWSFFGNEFHPTNPPIYFWERMQYTGLKDKNGKEIYEGDIVRRKYTCSAWSRELEPEIVKYDEDWAAFRPLNCPNDDGFRIIGNIYEHKNLLDK